MPSHPVITVGTFDGVHLGHKKIIEHAIEFAKELGTFSEIITFENPPSTILKPEKAKGLITNPEHKLNLIHALKPDKVTQIPFTANLANESAEIFIKKFQPKALVLGYDARIGKDRTGDPAHLKALSSQLHFDLHYIEPLVIEHLPVSSTRIREAILAGRFSEASLLLGRPYSIFGPIVPGEKRGTKMGYPTLNIPVTGLILPPLGVYAVTIGSARGVANLGFAPMFHREGPPLLEVHLLDPFQPTPSAEVIFTKFLRPEKTFATIDALQEQIKLDIETALNYFT